MQKGLYINETDFRSFQEINQQIEGSELATRKALGSFKSLMGSLPNPDEVLRKLGKDTSVYDQLMYDSHIISCVQQREAGVLSRKWDIDRGKSKSRPAKFIYSEIEKLDVHHLTQQMVGAAFYGYQPFEVVWDTTTTAQYKLKKVEDKPRRWFMYDDENRLMLRDQEYSHRAALVPERKFLVARHRFNYENPYGFALLSTCFWYVAFKKGGLKFWSVFTEKYGMPYLIGKTPRGTKEAEQNKLADNLEAAVQDAILVIFDDQSVEVKDNNSAASADIYERLIDVCNAEISKALLTQTLTTQQGKSGSYGLGKEHGDQKGLLTLSDTHIVESVYNELISWIDFYNFNSTEKPKFILYDEQEVDQAQAERDKTLKDQGVKFKKSYFAKTYNIPEEDFEVEGDVLPADNPPAKFADPAKGKFLTKAVAAESLFPDQVAIDKLLQNQDSTQFDEMMASVIQPVLDLVNRVNSFQELQDEMAKLYSEMDETQMQNMIEKFMFISETWGRLNG